MYKWYFSGKADGATYLSNYKYNAFDRSDVFEIMTNFLIGINVITFFYLLPEPLLMRRMNQSPRGRGDGNSITSNDSSIDGKFYSAEKVPYVMQ